MLFLSLVCAFHKNFSIKNSQEKRATSPKFKQFMPKISEIALKNKKKTDIGINPIVSIWCPMLELNWPLILTRYLFYR